MFIRKFDLTGFEPMGECRWQLLYPWKGVANPPFWSAWTHLKPGEKTKKHQHHEFETFLIAQGRGELRVNEERIEVGPGDVLYMPPFNDHILKNTSEGEDILLLSFFWEDMKELSDLEAESSEHAERRVLVTATPGATARDVEIHARYLAMRGLEVRRDEPVPNVVDAARSLAERLVTQGKLAIREHPAPHLAFPMAPYTERLREHYLAAHLPPRVRAVGERALADPLPEVAVSAAGTDGVPAPGLSGQVLTADFVAAATLAAGWDWRSVEGAAVRFCGPDEIYRSALFEPAVLLAADPEARLPQTVVVSDPDAEPAALSAAAVAACRAWWSEVAARLAAERGGEVPATGFWTPEQRRFYKRLLQRVQEAEEAYEAKSFDPAEIGRLLAEVVRTTRRFAEAETVWIGVPDRQNERRTSLALELVAAKIVAMIAAPLAPELAAELAQALGSAQPLPWEQVPGWVPAGARLTAAPERPALEVAR